MSRIVISYRRTDSEDVSGRIYDALVDPFGEGNIFKDVYSIPLGTDFRRALREAVANCQLMLVVIGKQWLTAMDEQGRRRLDYAGDFVRIEVEEALKRDIPVIPVLVQGASVPRESELPDGLADLAYRNGFAVRGDPYFRSDVNMLIARMTEVLKNVAAPASASPVVPPASATWTDGPPRPRVNARPSREQPRLQAELLLSEGKAIYNRTKFAEALPLLERAAQLDPGNENAWLWLALTRLGLGQDDAALNAVDRAIAANPNDKKQQVTEGYNTLESPTSRRNAVLG